MNKVKECALPALALLALLTISPTASFSRGISRILQRDTVTSTVSGGFTIVPEAGDTIVGDGINEETYWRFTFSPPPFDPGMQVVSAIITLNLTPEDALASNDNFRIEECGCGSVDVGSHPLHVPYQFTTNLISVYPPQLFLDSLFTNHGIEMDYQDDAIISSVQLQLVLVTTGIGVISPYADERLLAGAQDTIIWAGGGSDSLIVEFSTDDGATYSLIANNVNVSLGSYVWTVPDALSTTCRIRLTEVNNASSWGESDRFRVKGYVMTRFDVNGQYEAYRPDDHGWSFGNSDGINYAPNPPDRSNAVMWPQSFWNQLNYASGIDPFTHLPFPADFTNQPLPASTQDFIDWGNFVEAFGVNACYLNVAAGIYNPQAFWLWKGNKGNWTGSCEGFAVSSILAFDRPADFRSAYPRVPNFTLLSQLAITDTLRSAINQLSFVQFAKSHYTYRLQNSTTSPRETLEDLKQMLQSETNDHSYLYLSDSTKSVGHAVIPYRLERIGSSSSWFVHIYDCNAQLDTTQFVTIDSAADSWHTAVYGWHGNRNCFLMDPASTYLQAPTIQRIPPLAHENRRTSGASDRNGAVYTSSYKSVVIDDAGFRQLGCIDSTIFNTFQDAVPIVPLTSVTQAPVGYTLPFGDNFGVYLTRPRDSTSSAIFMGDSSSFAFHRSDNDSTTSEILGLIEGQFTLSNNSSFIKRYDYQSVILNGSAQTEFDFSGIPMGPVEYTSLIRFAGGDLELLHESAGSGYDLKAHWVSPTGEWRFEHKGINAAPFSIQLFHPSWDSIPAITMFVDNDGNGIYEDTVVLSNDLTGITSRTSPGVPREYSLSQNFPNPFNPLTTILFTIREEGKVSLKVYDILGREVATLVDERLRPGSYSRKWDASKSPSGVYFYRLTAGSFSEVKKLVITR